MNLVFADKYSRHYERLCSFDGVPIRHTACYTRANDGEAGAIVLPGAPGVWLESVADIPESLRLSEECFNRLVVEYEARVLDSVAAKRAYQDKRRALLASELDSLLSEESANYLKELLDL